MRLCIAPIVCLIFLQSVVCVFGQFPTEEQIAQRKMMLEHFYSLTRSINDKTVPFEQVEIKIKVHENITKDNLLWYLESMDGITGQLQNRGDDEEATRVAREIIAKAAYLPLDKKTLNLEEQTKVLEYQLLTMMTFEYRLRKTDKIIERDPKLRQKNADRLLEIFQLIMKVEKNYAPDADASMPDVGGQFFIPPKVIRSPLGTVPLKGMGLDYSNDEDKETREAYKKYIAKEWAQSHKDGAHSIAWQVREYHTEDVVEYLVDAYSLLPYRTTELAQILKKRQFDPRISKTILETVRKTEKEFPDEGSLTPVPQVATRKMSIRFSPTRGMPLFFRSMKPLLSRRGQ